MLKTISLQHTYAFLKLSHNHLKSICLDFYLPTDVFPAKNNELSPLPGARQVKIKYSYESPQSTDHKICSIQSSVLRITRMFHSKDLCLEICGQTLVRSLEKNTKNLFTILI